MAHIPQITPLILGSGRAGQAIASSFANLNLIDENLAFAPAVFLERGASIADAVSGHPNPIFCISNPHGLHAETILAAEAAGAKAILCEKPAAVSLDEVKRLSGVKSVVAVLHGYRQTWGMQTLKRMEVDGELGEIVAIEGRYWQSSTAERALTEARPSTSWKNDTRLSGEFDTYLDIGSHWMDAASFLLDTVPSEIRGWRSYSNAEAAHRDSHVQIAADFPNGGRAFASFSKNLHGATNQFEIQVVGSKRSAKWEFLNPDEILIGEGRTRRTLARRDCELGSKYPPFHGFGWTEGYIEIARCLAREVYLGKAGEYPKLPDNLKLLEAMLKTRWPEAKPLV
jgi:predicted dehydrogenase